MATQNHTVSNSWQRYAVGDGVLQVIAGKIFVSSNAPDSLTCKSALAISQFLNTRAGYLYIRTAANNGADSEIVIDDGVDNTGG